MLICSLRSQLKSHIIQCRHLKISLPILTIFLLTYILSVFGAGIDDVNLISPGNNTWINGTNDTIQFQFNYTGENATASCELLINDTAYGINVTVYNETTTTMKANDTINEGTNYWYVNCTNGTTTKSNTWALYVDRTAPAPSLIFPANNTKTTNSSIDFQFNVTDNLAPTLNCSLYINNTMITYNASTSNATTTNFTQPVSEGQNQNWTVNCSDNAGNANQAGARNFTVDLTAPNIGNKFINESGSVDANTMICLNVSGISDSSSGVDTVWAGVTQSNGSTLNVTMSDTGSCAGGSGDGWYSVNVDVGDSSGTFYYNNAWVNDTVGNDNSNNSVQSLSVALVITPTGDNTYINKSSYINISASPYTISDSSPNGVLIFNCSNCWLDCNNSVFKGDGESSTYGMYVSSKENVTIRNCNIQNYNYGIYLDKTNHSRIDNINATAPINTPQSGITLSKSHNNTIINSFIDKWQSGIKFTGMAGTEESYNNTIENNIITRSNKAGISAFPSPTGTVIRYNTINLSGAYGILLAAENCTVFKNIFEKNTVGIDFNDEKPSNYTNVTDNNLSFNYKDFDHVEYAHNLIFSSNRFSDNLINTMLNNFSAEGLAYTNELAEFNISLFYPNGTSCAGCSINTSVSPKTTAEYSKSGNNISGNFTPTRLGIYTMSLNSTDDDGNFVERDFKFFANATETRNITYYFTGGCGTHGQPCGNDASRMMINTTNYNMNGYCGGWVQISPDDLPNYTFGYINNISASIWYYITDGYLGIERYMTYTYSVDYNKSVPDETSYTFITRNFTNLNWSADYLWSWYGVTIKLYGGLPDWKSNNTHPSFVNISYYYTNTPEIVYISNEYVKILSATSPPEDTDNATIILEGSENITLIVQMPDCGKIYSTKMDGNDCNDQNCSFTQSAGKLEFNLSLVSTHVIEITSNQPPTVIITYPANTTYYNVTYFNFTVSEIPDTCWYNTGSGNNTITCQNETPIYFSTEGAKTLEVYANDSSNNIGGDTEYFTLDQTSPEHSNLTQNVSNQSAYNPDYSYQFNSTWTDPSVVDTVYFEWQANNYTASNISDEYYYVVGGLAAGNYTYKWCANDTLNNWNCTQNLTYSITKASNDLTITGTGTFTFPTQTSVDCSATDGTPDLYRNATSIPSPPDAGTFGVGTYNYSCNISESTNYTANSTYQLLQINQNSTNPVLLYLNGSQSNLSITYGESVNATGFTLYSGAGTVDLYINNSPASNPYLENLAAGTYTIKANTSGNDNYTSNSTGVEYWLTVNKSSTKTDLYHNDTLWTFTYTFTVPETVIVNGTINVSSLQSSVSCYFNGTSSTNPNTTTYTSETYLNWSCHFNGDDNYTSSSNQQWLEGQVNDTTPPTITITYPLNTTYYNVTYFNFTVSETPDTCWYNLNSGGNTTFTCGNNTAIIPVPNQQNILEVYANDSANNTGGDTEYFTLDQTAPDITFLTPPTPNNETVTTNYTYINLTISEPGYCLLDWNGTNQSMDNTSENYYLNKTELPNGNYTFSAWCNDTIGNLNKSESRWVYINWTFVDTTIPSYYNGQDDSSGLVIAGITVNISVNWTDNVQLDTSILRHNASGSWQNESYLSLSGTTQYANFSIDTAGQSGETICWVQWTNDTAGNLNATMPQTAHCFDVSTNISACQELNKPNTVYKLGKNIVPSEPSECIVISAQNITLDCKGFWISNNTLEYIGIYSNQYNTTIKNCNVSMAEKAGGIGIKLFYANNSYIFNNTLNDQGYGLLLNSSRDARIEDNKANSNNFTLGLTDYGYGIVLESCRNNTLINNTANYNSYEGIYLLLSPNNTLINNTANSNDVGISLLLSSNNSIQENSINSNFNGITFSGSSNNRITKNDIFNCNSVYDKCIGVYNSDYNVFSSNKINKGANQGVWIASTAGQDSSHNIFRDTKMTGINGTSVVMEDAASSENLNNTFLNFTYNNESVDSNSELIRKWYIDVNVTNSTGNSLQDINVSFYNSSSAFIDHNQTQPNGFTKTFELVEYINTSTTSYWTNYTLYANDSTGTYSNYTNTTVDFSTNIKIDVIMLPPDNTTPTVFITHPQSINYSYNESLPLNYSASDPNLDSCWYNLDGGSNTTTPRCSNTTFNVSTEGSHTLYLYANDSAGNTNNTEFVTFTADLTNPTVSITYPTNTTYYNVTYFNFTVSETPDTCWYNLNSGGNTTFTCGNNTAITPAADQQNTLEVYANDSANNTGGDTEYFTLDQTSPQLINITNGTVYGSLAYIEWITDEDANSTVIYGTNETTLDENKTDPSLIKNHSIDLYYLTKNTTYYYNVTSCDAAGNCNLSGPFNFTTPECTPSWTDCTEWLECSGGEQSRTCNDVNRCEYPWWRTEEQECEMPSGPSPWTPKPPANVSMRPELVPGVGIVNNTKLFEAVERVLAKGELSEGARENLLRLSVSITQDLSVERNMYFSGTTTKLRTKIKYAGKKKAKNFMVFERTTKTFANNAKYVTITAPDAIIEVVEEDPSWLLLYSEVNPGDELSITYEAAGKKGSSVPHQIETEVYAESLEEIEKPEVPPSVPEKICTPGEKQCYGTDLQECSSDGLEWITLESCTYGCDATNLICRRAPKTEAKPKPQIDIATTVFAAGLIAFAILVTGTALFTKHRKKANKEKRPKIEKARKKPVIKERKPVVEIEEVAEKIEKERPDIAVATVEIKKAKEVEKKPPEKPPETRGREEVEPGKKEAKPEIAMATIEIRKAERRKRKKEMGEKPAVKKPVERAVVERIEAAKPEPIIATVEIEKVKEPEEKPPETGEREKAEPGKKEAEMLDKLTRDFDRVLEVLGAKKQEISKDMEKTAEKKEKKKEGKT